MARDMHMQDSNRPAPADPAPLPSDERDGREARIGENLRHIYDDVLSEPIPDSLQDLLRKLD